MKNPATVLLSLSFAIVIFCGVFIWNPPAPRFYPLEGVWRMPSEKASGPAMGWYGRTGAALLAGAVSGGVGSAVAAGLSRRKPIRLAPPAVFAVALLVLVALAGASSAVVFEQQVWFQKEPAPPKPDHEY